MPGGDVVSSGSRYPGVARPPSFGSSISRALSHVSSSVGNAVHQATTPHQGFAGGISQAINRVGSSVGRSADSTAQRAAPHVSAQQLQAYAQQQRQQAARQSLHDIASMPWTNLSHMLLEPMIKGSPVTSVSDQAYKSLIPGFVSHAKDSQGGGGFLGAIEGLPVVGKAAKIGLNLGKDVVNLAPSTLQGVETLGPAILHDIEHGQIGPGLAALSPATALASLATGVGSHSKTASLLSKAVTQDPFFQIATGHGSQGLSSLENHPLQGILDAAGGYGLVGKAAGAAARAGVAGENVAKAASLARASRELAPDIEGSSVVRHYSPNLITQGIQKLAESKGLKLPDRTPLLGSKAARTQQAAFEHGAHKSQTSNDLKALNKTYRAVLKGKGRAERGAAPYVTAFGGGKAMLQNIRDEIATRLQNGQIDPGLEHMAKQHIANLDAAIAKPDLNLGDVHEVARAYNAAQDELERQQAELGMHDSGEMQRSLEKQFALERPDLFPKARFEPGKVLDPRDILERRQAAAQVRAATKDLNEAKVTHAGRLKEMTDKQREFQQASQKLAAARARAGMDALRGNQSDAALRRVAAADVWQSHLHDLKTAVDAEHSSRAEQAANEISAKTDALKAAQADYRDIKGAPRRYLTGLLTEDPKALPVAAGNLKGLRLRQLGSEEIQPHMANEPVRPSYVKMTNPERTRPDTLDQFVREGPPSSSATGKPYTGAAAKAGDWRTGVNAMYRSQAETVRAIGRVRERQAFIDRFGLKDPNGEYFTPGNVDRAKYDYEREHGIKMERIVDSRAGPGKYVLMPHEYAGELKRQLKLDLPGPASRFFLAGNRMFRNTVLPMSPKLPIMHTVENVSRAGLIGATPTDYFRARRVLKAMTPEAAQRLQELATPGGLGGLQYRLNAEDFSRHEPLIDTSNKGQVAAQAVKQAAPALMRGWEWTAQKIIGAQRAMEKGAQTAALGVHMRKSLQEWGHNWFDANTSVQRYTEALAKGYSDPALAEDAAKFMHKTMGQYNNFTARQRWFISRVAPFSPWYMNAAKLVFMGLPKDHPLMSALIQDVHQATAQQWNSIHTGLPPDMQSFLPDGPGKWLDVGKFGPIGLEKQPLNEAASLLIPQYAGALHALMGQDPFGGEFKGPNTPYGKAEMQRGIEGDQSGGALLQAVNQLLESYGGPVPSLARAAESHGATLYNTSTLWNPQTKPNSSHGLSGLLGGLERVFNPVRPVYRQAGGSGGDRGFGGGSRQSSGSGGSGRAFGSNQRANSPTAAIADVGARVATSAERTEAVNEFKQEFEKLQGEGLLPQGAKMPKIVFDKKNMGQGFGMYTLASKGEVHIPPNATALFGGSNRIADLRDWARTAIIHELGHTMQTPQTFGLGPANFEGGAQAWTQRVAPRALTELNGPSYRWPGSGNYSDWVMANDLREPGSWIMHGQFDPHATPPAINAPFTPAGRLALERVVGWGSEWPRFKAEQWFPHHA